MQSSRSALPTSWISRTNPDEQKVDYARQAKRTFRKNAEGSFFVGNSLRLAAENPSGLPQTPPQAYRRKPLSHYVTGRIVKQVQQISGKVLEEISSRDIS